jgi:hypothetical protein
MGFRLLLVATKRLLIGIGALWLISVPHIRPQLASAQFQEVQRQQQQALQNEWPTSHWDLGQNIRLDAIDTHITATDHQVDNLRDKHESLAREVSDGQGASRVWFGIIGAALIGALTFSFSNFLKIRDAERKQ